MMAEQTSLRLSESEEVTDYRSVSAWAVVGLAAGLLSFVSLAHPSLWLVPLFAIACSAMGLARIYWKSDVLFGRRAAVIGLALGIFFLACAPLRYYGERYLLERQASDYFVSWIELLKQGRLGEAHQATLHPRYRQPDGTDLEAFYQESEDDRLDRDEFFNFGVAKDLVEMGPEVSARLDQTLAVYFLGKDQQVTQRWLIYPTGEQTSEPAVKLHIQITRTADRDGDYWQLVGLADAKSFEKKRP